jgi:hypothetical protein
MVVCTVGTGDKQDQMLTHVGLTAVPLARPSRCNDFEDEVRVMYCTGIDQLNPRFCNIVDEMAKTIGAISG